jgi:hypothetical protein
MPQFYIVEKIDLSRNAEMELMKFSMPTYSEHNGEFYRQGTSFNAFFKRSDRNKHKGFLYYAKWEDDYLFERKLMKELGATPKDRIIPSYPSIWEFYKAIGYDYKKKKFIKGE